VLYWLNLLKKCLEAPKGVNDFCPRKNGFFASPDPEICDVFYQCVDGEFIENKCSAGLHFDEYSGKLQSL
jgi:Chitin binding Peritrophin-A domain